MSTALQARFLAAVESHKAGNSAGAALLLEELLAQWPTTHEAHYLLAMIQAEQADMARAVAGFQRALELDPENPEYLFRLGSALSRLGRSDEAIDALQRAAEQAEESPDLYLELVRVALLARRVDPALAAIDRAWQLASNRPELQARFAANYGTISQACERANRLEESRAAAERALSIRPDNGAALVTMGKLLFREKRSEEARACLEKVLETGPKVERLRETHRMLGLVCDQLKDYDRAYEHFVGSKLSSHKVLPPSHQQFGPRAYAYLEACRRDVRPEDVARWTSPPEDRPSPVFFVGFPRSGTTLLEQMLGSHPAIVTTDELHTLPMLVRRIIGMEGFGEHTLARLGTLSEQQILELREAYWAHTERELPGAAARGRLLLDKHPLNTPNLAVARRLFPGARVIMALRDPRDVVLSCFMMLNRTPISIAMFSSLESTARYYATIMDLWLHQRDFLGLPWIAQRYEDLVDDPEGQIRRILDFLGLPWDDGVLKFTERTAARSIRSASYQQVTQGIHKRAKGRWQNYEKHYGPALETLRPYLKALGYED